MLEKQIELELIKCRRLLTRSVTDLEEFSTMERIRKNYSNFIKECHKCYKETETILINRILGLEDAIEQAKKQKQNVLEQIESKKLLYWKIILELFFNSFVWLALHMDKSNVRKIFKGVKFGMLKYQNIESVLTYIRNCNNEPNEFAIPLDFCHFSCITDVLKLRYNEHKQKLQLLFLELKEGKVNEQMIETISKGEKKDYFQFFERYGSKGIKQMSRFFRQHRSFVKNFELIDATPGIYKSPDNESENLLIYSDSTSKEPYIEKILRLLDAADQNKYAVDIIDECLVIGIINNMDENYALLGDFDIKLFIYHEFIDPDVLYQSKLYPSPTALSGILRKIQLTDWRTGFNSVILLPIAINPLPDRYLMDLLFGRKRLMCYFDAKRFIELCKKNGVKAYFVDSKETKRLRSRKKAKGLVEFDGRFIGCFCQNCKVTLGEGVFHEMLYNWIRPISVVNQLKSMKFPAQENNYSDKGVKCCIQKGN